MTWFAIISWFFIFYVCLNIALQIYYKNKTPKPEQIKIQMARLDPIGYLPQRQTTQKAENKENLGWYDSFIQHIANVVNEISEGFRIIRQCIISILSPKLYAIIG